MLCVSGEIAASRRHSSLGMSICLVTGHANQLQAGRAALIEIGLG